jgi:hypothetical protein
MHIDTDESNACCGSGTIYGQLVALEGDCDCEGEGHDGEGCCCGRHHHE